ncbi:hypothetical protein Dimus_025986 [Dionaea muscipula]
MLSATKLESISQLLQHFKLTHNLNAVKHLHARLLRTGWLFHSPNDYANVIFAYSTISPRNFSLRPLLANLLSSINSRDPAAFNLLVSGFCRNGYSILALRTLSFMHGHEVVLDSYALCSALTASSVVSAVEFGQQVHGYLEKSGWSASVFLGSAVVGLYGRSSLLIDDAEKVFDEIPMKNTVCANTLLVAYCEAKLWSKGIALLRRMPMLELNCDRFTLTAALSCCAGLAIIDMGRQVHGHLIRTVVDFERDVFMLSALVEMYGKCGLVGKARDVFSLRGFNIGEDCKRDVVLWTSMLGAYGRNGHHIDVIKLYDEMLVEGIRPDGVAFVTVISACSHTGKVGLGLQYFESMVRDFGLNPGSEHYSCMTDLLCRAGELEKAWKLVNEIPHGAEIHASLWGALLQACCAHGNINLGRLAVKKVLELDPENTGIHALLLNLYAKFGMRDEIEQVTKLMNEKGLRKDIACSWIAVRS